MFVGLASIEIEQLYKNILKLGIKYQTLRSDRYGRYYVSVDHEDGNKPRLIHMLRPDLCFGKKMGR